MSGTEELQVGPQGQSTVRVSRKQGEIAPIIVKLWAFPLENCMNIVIRLCTYTEAHPGP